MQKHFLYFSVFFLVLVVCLPSKTIVDLRGNKIPIKLTWKSTGLCPPLPHEEVCEWIKSPSFVQNLAWISAIPNKGIEFIRVHWLLNAVLVASVNVTNVTYNFSCLDYYLEMLHGYDILPILELMGNPSNLFNDFENKTQIINWSDLVFVLATRYINKFGLDYVGSWMFETWNEPKPTHFDSLKMSPQGFLNYYEASASGLKRAHGGLKLVTPGGGCSEKLNPTNFCWHLLDHIHRRMSKCSDSQTIVPDLISIHKKGIYPNSSNIIIEEENKFISQLDKFFPLLRNTGIINDESDPEVSWDVSRSWQADVSYAVLVVKIIHDHLSSFGLVQKRIKLLSNDNAFLTFHPFPFTRRTMLARFQVNVTDPPHIQFIRKPSYIVLGLLSLFGDKLIVKEFDHSTASENKSIPFNLIATVHEPEDFNGTQCWYLSLIAVNIDLNIKTDRVSRTFELVNIPVEIYPDMVYIIHYMDNFVSNPFKIWNESGGPQTPSSELFEKIRSYEEPRVKFGPSPWTQGTSGQITIEMESLSIALIQFCSRSCDGPGQVVDLKVMNVTFNQAFILWSDLQIKTKCISTYEVEHSVDGLKFRRINPKPTIFNSYVYVPHLRPYKHKRNEETVGSYRVRAVDFWNVPGKYSLPLKYPQNNF